MANDSLKAAEALLEEVFVALLNIGDMHGITIKRMAELLPEAQIRAMRRQGRSQQEIMAASGYALKTIRKILANPGHDDNYSHVDRFVGDWKTDPDFPDTLPINSKKFPSFSDVVHRYGREFRPGALLRILIDQGLVQITENTVHLTSRAVVPTTSPERIDSARIACRNFLATLTRNISEVDTPLMERRVWSYMIPDEDLPSVRNQVKTLSNAFKEVIVEILIAAEDPKKAEKSNPHRAAGFGMYWFE
ncbi:MAG: hypothetical protein Tsb002_14580 [Wenzhouxiangellaceae bacterium]